MNLLLTGLAIIILSLQSLFCKLFARHYPDQDAGAASSVFNLSYGLFAGAATLLLAGLRFSPSPATWLLGLLNAGMLFLYNLAMIQAGRTGSYAFQTIAMLFGGIVVPLLYGVLFLQDTLSPLQWAAILLMLVSFVLLNLKSLSLKGNSKRFLFWCLVLFLANGFYGVLMNLQQLRMQGTERNEMIMLTYLGMALLSAALQGARNPRGMLSGFRMPCKPLIFLLLCCLCATIGCHMTLFMLGRIDAAVYYSLVNGGVLLLSVVYSRILFQEKLAPAQMMGFALALGAMVMLSV